MATKQQREELMRTFARFNFECPLMCNNGNAGALIEILEKLHHYETTLHRLAETACNRELSEQEQKQESAVKENVRAIAELLNFKVQFNGDPRGGAIRFVLPSGASNNFDGETWGIYW